MRQQSLKRTNVVLSGTPPTHNQIFVAYTVPGGQKIIITDVIVTAGGITSSNCATKIFRDAVLVSTFCVTNGIYQHTYKAGIEFKEAAEVGIQRGTEQLFFELRGYLTDIT